MNPNYLSYFVLNLTEANRTFQGYAMHLINQTMVQVTLTKHAN